MSNKKITQLNTNTNPILSDVFPIVNNNITKKLSLDGLVTFLTPYFSGSTEVFVTGGTYNVNTGVLNLINNTGGTVSISGFYTGSTEVFVTGGTYTAGTATFRNNTGGTFSVTGFSTGGTGTVLYWYDENNTPPSVAPIASGNGSIAFGDSAMALGTGSFVYGKNAGSGATSAFYSNIFGENAGLNSNGYACNFLGFDTGNGGVNVSYSNFIGYTAGFNAANVTYSNFIGFGAGANATNATYSNFIGRQAGYDAINASYSNLFGFNAGASFTGNELSSNNIIIGTNISLPNNAVNSINIGGVLFGTGTYSTTSGNPSISANTIGKIGVGVVTPTANLHIAASTTAQAIMRLEVGPAPTSPNDGDIWLESNDLSGLKIRINGVTRTINIT